MASRRRKDEQSNAGWLYADVLLGLLVVFLAASAINKPSGSGDSAPHVVSVTSSLADGQYGVGSEIDVVIEFDQPVTARGNILLRLETNNEKKFAELTSNSENQIYFSYQVQEGDATPDLDYFDQESLLANNGAVRSLTGLNAVTDLPVPGEEGSLSANKTIVIETAVPITPEECTANINRNPIEFSITWTKDMGAGNLLKDIKSRLGEQQDKNVGVLLIYGGQIGKSIDQAKSDAADVRDALLGNWPNINRAYFKILFDTGRKRGDILLNFFMERSCD